MKRKGASRLANSIRAPIRALHHAAEPHIIPPTMIEENHPKTARALALISGGLDSQLAVCVLKEQGVHVEGICFESPFFDSAKARRAAQQAGVELHVVDFTVDIAALLEHPRHGFGACMNPCIDCHLTMLRRAGERMTTMGFDFLVTGEVLNQRPMSQTPHNLEVVARESGYADLVLRPLCARLLPETRPEREGWVDRGRLLDLNGRNRKPQLALAAKYGFKDIPTPAGGCLLTEPQFCGRVRDLRAHEGLADPRDLRRLRWGRHFRLADRVKLILGRNRQENEWLEHDANPEETVLCTVDVPGPTGVLSPGATEDQIQGAAAICVRYSDGRNAESAIVLVRQATGERQLNVAPARPEEEEKVRVS